MAVVYILTASKLEGSTFRTTCYFGSLHTPKTDLTLYLISNNVPVMTIYRKNGGNMIHRCNEVIMVLYLPLRMRPHLRLLHRTGQHAINRHNGPGSCNRAFINDSYTTLVDNTSQYPAYSSSEPEDEFLV